MADTIGDLIDKLTISNIRLWHIEDARREYCSQNTKDETKARDFLNMISNVNKERNRLIDQINAGLRVLLDAMQAKETHVALSVEDLLGTGKNKFYKKDE